MEIIKTQFCGWKNCLKLKDGDTEVIVTTDFGPRIISLEKAGKGNHFRVFPDTAGKVVKSDGFVAYGGHRVWHAPERADRTYFSDNSACEVNESAEGLSVMAPVERQTNLRRGFIINMENGAVTVRHVLENKSLFDVRLSVWGLSQFETGGVLAVPTAARDTGLVANRAVSLWPYCSMNDRRVYWGGGYIAVTPDDKDTPAFKFGYTAAEGRAVYFNRGQAVIKRLQFDEKGEYPNYGCNFESYCGRDFIEIESLSPLVTLPTNGRAELTEQWTVRDGVLAPAAADEPAVMKALAGLGL